MRKEEIRKLIRQILKDNNYGVKMSEDFDNSDSLFSRGIVDSFGIFTFINELRVKFNLEIEDREIHPGNFETIEKITGYIYSKKEVIE